ncbi:unnamed protein product [Urochloa humidicola]
MRSRTAVPPRLVLLVVLACAGLLHCGVDVGARRAAGDLLSAVEPRSDAVVYPLARSCADDPNHKTDEANAVATVAPVGAPPPATGTPMGVAFSLVATCDW